MKNLLRRFDTPTNVIALGVDITGIPQSFSITDDYHTLDIRVANNQWAGMIETEGYVFILTDEEFLKYYDLIKYDEETSDKWMIVFKNFIGNIAVEVQNSDTREDLMIDDFEPLGEGILYQTIDEVDLNDISFEAVLKIYRENPEESHLPYYTDPIKYHKRLTNENNK